jgi:hypothetical protein
MNNKKIITSIPIEFDKQDEGHGPHNPLTWKAITTYYAGRGVYPFKSYNRNKVNATSNARVLTGVFEGTQVDDEIVRKHFEDKWKKQYATSVKNLK